MATTVELEGVIGFTLDDAQKGILDSTSFPLGNLFYDITSYVTGVSISRGKNRDLDRFSAGTLNVELRNDTRAFDPLYTASPFNGSIVPRRLVNVTTDGVRQFTGIIDDWDLAYKVNGDSTASIKGADAFTVLAQQQVASGTAVNGQTSGQRVNTVLSQSNIAWPVAKRVIDTGQSILGADVFDGNALEYLQKVETSEQGNLFMSKNGDVVFQSRNVTPTSAKPVTVFSDNGSGIPYVDAAVNYGTELLTNQAYVSSAVGTAVANNSVSQGLYETVSLDVSTLVNNTTQLQNLADYIVASHGQPEYRFDKIVVSLNGLTPTQKITMLNLELGDLTQIIFTPNKVGSAIVRNGQIIKLDQSIGIDRHSVTIGVASVLYSYLVLSDAEYGKLDSSYVLGF